MATITIGSLDQCDIQLYKKNIARSVWATITASNDKMLLLQILVNNIRCFVNRNNVTSTYWIKYGDEISINGYVLDWTCINRLLPSANVNSTSDWSHNLRYATSIRLDIGKVSKVGTCKEEAASIIFSPKSNWVYLYDCMPLPPQVQQCDKTIEFDRYIPKRIIKLSHTKDQYHQLTEHLMAVKYESGIKQFVYTEDTSPDIFYRIRLHVDMPGYDDPILYIDTEISHHTKTSWSTQIFLIINILVSYLSSDSDFDVKRFINNLGI